MKSLRKVASIILAGTSLLLAACAEGALEPEIVDPCAAVTPGPLHATYTSTVTPADFPPSAPPEAFEGLTGNWELTFNACPTTSVTRRNGNPVVTGSYTTESNRIVVTDDSGSMACLAPAMRQGVYEWALEGGNLRLTRVQDTCDGRAFVLTVHLWQRQ
jgi:hypothetical protein